jgi:hypothetical protein
MSFEVPRFDPLEEKELDALVDLGIPKRVRRLEERDAALLPTLASKVALIDASNGRLEKKVTILANTLGAPRVERTQIREGGRESIIIEPASGIYEEHEKTRAEMVRTREAVEAARAEIDETGKTMARMDKRMRSKWRSVGQALAVIIMTLAGAFGAYKTATPSAPPAQGGK